MKNKRFAAAVMALAIAVAGIGFSGCGSNASATNAASNSNEAQITDTTINGTLWNDFFQEDVYTFDNNKNFSIIARKYNSSRYTADGTYTLKDGILTLTYRENHSETSTFKKSVKDGKTVFIGQDTYILFLNDSDAQKSIQERSAKTSSQSSK